MCGRRRKRFASAVVSSFNLANFCDFPASRVTFEQHAKAIFFSILAKFEMAKSCHLQWYLFFCHLMIIDNCPFNLHPERVPCKMKNLPKFFQGACLIFIWFISRFYKVDQNQVLTWLFFRHRKIPHTFLKKFCSKKV